MVQIVAIQLSVTMAILITYMMDICIIRTKSIVMNM